MANAILIELSQIGTVTKTLECIQITRDQLDSLVKKPPWSHFFSMGR